MPATFAKSRPTAADAYPAEAAGLTWLAAAGPDAARVVEVVAVSPEQLVLRRLAPAPATRRAAADFGAALAATHAAGATAYGAPPDGWAGDGYIGTQPLTLRPTARWGASSWTTTPTPPGCVTPCCSSPSPSPTAPAPAR